MHRYYNEGPEERQFNMAHLRMGKAEKTISLGDALFCFNTGYSSRHPLQLLSSPTFRQGTEHLDPRFQEACAQLNLPSVQRGHWSQGPYCRLRMPLEQRLALRGRGFAPLHGGSARTAQAQLDCRLLICRRSA